MNILQALRAHLAAQASVTARVGSRIYPLILPQDPTYPAITYSPIGTRRAPTFDGAPSLIGSEIEIDAWGQTLADAETLGGILEGLLENFCGVFGAVDGLRIYQVLIDADVTVFETEPAAYRRSLLFVFYHTR